MMPAIVRMPALAAGAVDAAIQAWLVEVGQEVAAGQVLVEIETEKAVVEHESEESGRVAALLLPAGEAGAVGSPIAVIAVGAETIEDALRAAEAEIGAVGRPSDDPAPAPAPEDAGKSDTAAAQAVAAGGEAVASVPAQASDAVDEAVVQLSASRMFASPLVRRIAKERGLDLSTVSGSGPHGRIVRRDLDALPDAPAAVQAPPPAASAASAAVASPEYVDVPHTGMRRAIARRLTESKSTVPHFYLTADCRVDALLALRAQINGGGMGAAKISVNDLVVKAVAWALRDVPEANAIWTDESTRRFSGVDIAVAVSVPGGLLTPVLRGVERMSVSEIGGSLRDLAERARSGRLKQHELEGGSFSVSNLGMYGTQEFSAIINPPHAGILAVGAASLRPVVDAEGQLGVGQVLTVTLSADHRVLDGALAAQWLSAFVTRIENPVSILV